MLAKQFAGVGREVFDGMNPTRTKDVVERPERSYHTVKTHLHLAGTRGWL